VVFVDRDGELRSSLREYPQSFRVIEIACGSLKAS
jgi:hypothetical protein